MLFDVVELGRQGIEMHLLYVRLSSPSSPEKDYILVAARIVLTCCGRRRFEVFVDKVSYVLRISRLCTSFSFVAFIMIWIHLLLLIETDIKD